MKKDEVQNRKLNILKLEMDYDPDLEIQNYPQYFNFK
jgi:hypothetical protein